MGELFLDRRGEVGITCLTALPEIVDPERRTLCCGYSDGTIRALCICRDGFVLVQALKPHTAPVVAVSYSPCGSFLASLAEDNSIFVFEVRNLEDHALPLGFLQVPTKVNHISWHQDNGRMLVALEDGNILELEKPVQELIDNTETYKFGLDYKIVTPEIPEPEESEADEEDEDGEGEE